MAVERTGARVDWTRVDAEIGTGNATVAGNARIGFYNVLVRNGIERVIHVGPSGRDQRLVATIPAPTVKIYDGPPCGVVFDGSFYFLDPAGTSAGVRLHRITPPWLSSPVTRSSPP